MLRGRRDVGEEGLGNAAAAFLLVDDRLAELDTFAADVDVARSFDQGADVAVALAAEGAIGVAVPPGAARGSPPSSRHARVFVRHAVFLARPGPAFTAAGIAGQD